MTTVEQAEGLVAKMTRVEKAELLLHLARDLGDAFPGIDVTDDVSGGDPCIARSRIPAWVLEQARRLGASEAELLRSYPGLRAQDLANAWAYVRTHRDGATGTDAQFQCGDMLTDIYKCKRNTNTSLRAPQSSADAR